MSYNDVYYIIYFVDWNAYDFDGTVYAGDSTVDFYFFV